MRKFNHDLSQLIDGKIIYKTGHVLVNLNDNTYLENVLIDNSENFRGAENGKHTLTYTFTSDITKAIRFTEEVERWLIYRNSPIVNNTHKYYADYKSPENPNGHLTFEPIHKHLERRA